MQNMAKKEPLTLREVRRLQARYRSLAKQLAAFESISQGSVMPQPPAAWRWTRKVAGKTVTRGLSNQKAQKMLQAIANQRDMDKIIDEMREITQKLILESPDLPQISVRKNPPKSALS
jgi:hypothetical protein